MVGVGGGSEECPEAEQAGRWRWDNGRRRGGCQGGSRRQEAEAREKGIDTRPTGGDDEDGTFDGSFGHSKALDRRQYEGKEGGGGEGWGFHLPDGRD